VALKDLVVLEDQVEVVVKHVILAELEILPQQIPLKEILEELDNPLEVVAVELEELAQMLLLNLVVKKVELAAQDQLHGQEIVR